MCGYDRCPAALTFHHPDPSAKDADIARFLDAPLAKYLAEVDKCRLLCFNCHMEAHWRHGSATADGQEAEVTSAINAARSAQLKDRGALGTH